MKTIEKITNALNETIIEVLNNSYMESVRAWGSELKALATAQFFFTQSHKVQDHWKAIDVYNEALIDMMLDHEVDDFSITMFNPSYDWITMTDNRIECHLDQDDEPYNVVKMVSDLKQLQTLGAIKDLVIYHADESSCIVDFRYNDFEPKSMVGFTTKFKRFHQALNDLMDCDS